MCLKRAQPGGLHAQQAKGCVPMSIDNNIVEFPARLAGEEAEAFEHEELANLFAVWKQQVRTGNTPLLRDFAPRRLGRWLGWSAIVDVPGRSLRDFAETPPSWRLAGSALCRLAGSELAGRMAFDDWQRFERATLNRLLTQGVEHFQAFLARLRLDAMDARGRADARLEVLALPLHDPARKANAMLMVFLPCFDADLVLPEALPSARLISLRTLDNGARPAQALLSDTDGEGARILPLFGNGTQRRPA